MEKGPSTDSFNCLSHSIIDKHVCGHPLIKQCTCYTGLELNKLTVYNVENHLDLYEFNCPRFEFSEVNLLMSIMELVPK